MVAKFTAANKVSMGKALADISKENAATKSNMKAHQQHISSAVANASTALQVLALSS